MISRCEARKVLEDQMRHRIGPRFQALEWQELDRSRRSWGQCTRLVAPIGPPLPGEDPVQIFQYFVSRAYGVDVHREELAGCHRSTNRKTIIARFNFNGPSSLVSQLTNSDSMMDGVSLLRMQVCNFRYFKLLSQVRIIIN